MCHGGEAKCKMFVILNCMYKDYVNCVKDERCDVVKVLEVSEDKDREVYEIEDYKLNSMYSCKSKTCTHIENTVV